MTALSEREEQLLKTMVGHFEPAEVFEIAAGADTLENPAWPDETRPPSRDEIRSLAAQDYLETDRTALRMWRFWPSDSTRAMFADDLVLGRAEALKDPDLRLGVILDAVVEAFEKDPAEPLLLLRTDQADIVRHPGWSIEPDVVRMHDLRQLEALGLVGWDGEQTFFPTPQGRMASNNPAAFLAQRADETEDDEERSRLRLMAEKLRAGDVAVGAAGGFTGAALRVLLGF